jgi:hypothetical protein
MLEVTVDVLLVFTIGVGVDDRLKVTVDSFVVPTAGVGVTIYAVDTFSGA